MSLAFSRRGLLIGAAAGSLSLHGPARGATSGQIDPQALQHDAEILHRAFVALHPGLHRYNSPADISSHFKALNLELSAPLSLGDAHLCFARLAAQIRCGHTYLNPSNQEGASLALNEGGRTRLPFRFRWVAERMVITGASSDLPELSAGCEVVSWNDLACARLLTQLMELAPADGGNDPRRRRVMELWGSDNWELFDIYAPLLHPDLVQGGVAHLRILDRRGETLAVDVPLLTRAQRQKGIAAGVITKGSTDPAWRLERLPGGAGWLTMRSWALFDSSWDWKAALNASLDELASDKAPALVLDLRGNGGGS